MPTERQAHAAAVATAAFLKALEAAGVSGPVKVAIAGIEVQFGAAAVDDGRPTGQGFDKVR
ncbi:MAG: hypothetical protein AAFU61_15145 [Pseudomonadota bacterium]